MTPRQLFHKASYCQYPFLIAGLIFAYVPFFNGFIQLAYYYNIACVFIGLGVSFSTLQDTTKMQNKLSQKIFSNPRHSRVLLFALAIQTLLFIIIGATGIFLPPENLLNQLAYGLLSLGIGMLGMLKAALEAAEYHGKKAI